jgi:hypothetical protein
MMIKFQDHKNYVVIDIVNQEDGDLPSHGDAYVTIEISSNGFSGHNHLWVSYSSIRSFCKNLIHLEAVRKGETILESISPGELHIFKTKIQDSTIQSVLVLNLIHHNL